MNPDQVTNFLSGYLCSLLEETRDVEAGPRYGIDRVVHQLALADGYVPVRLPFFRQADDQLGKPKKEAEHGVDMAFVSPDGSELQIFVLKDEALTYRNWTEEGFDKDLRLAIAPDLTPPQVVNVKRVRVILAYNKDEDEEGTECYERFVKSAPTKIADKVTLSCERWNLTDLTEQVKSKLLTPSLLPENFFRKFSYICAQFGDFEPGSPQWREVLLPDWKEFLGALLEGAPSERSLRMVSIALILLREHIRKNREGIVEAGGEAGWLDLVEWAMIRLWAAIQGSRKRALGRLVTEIWFEFYVQRLEEYYRTNGPLLASEHCLEIPGDAVEEAGGSYRAYWHLGRIGLLSLALWELLPSTSKGGDVQLQQIRSLLSECSNWMIGLFNANPSCYRPVLDIQHIEIFLVWRTFAQAQQWEQIETWLGALVDRLLLRRLGGGAHPLPDHRNSWEELFEDLGNTDSVGSERDIPSYLLLVLMELSVMLPEGKGNSIAASIHRFLIEGRDPNGKSYNPKQKVELVGWIPPADWPRRALRECVLDGYGVSVSLREDDVISSLEEYVKATTSAVEIELEGSGPVPIAVFLLACLKHMAPVPSFVWRRNVTAKNPKKTTAKKAAKKRSAKEVATKIPNKEKRRNKPPGK